MALWFVFALMTAAAIFAVLWPLSRREAATGGSDLAVYRDQLDEIGRDRAAGLVGVAEAEAAKVEVSRRLIAAAEAAETQSAATDSPFRRRATAVAALVLLPAGALALYLTLGSPQLPGEPLAERQRAENGNPSIESLVAQVEDRVARDPADGRGWEVLAPVYERFGRFDDAVRAWRNSLRINGATAAREANLGEALVAQSNGVVTAEAKSAFDRALALDAGDAKSLFYSGMAAEQDGRRDTAVAMWRDLIAKAPPGAPYIEVVRQAIARVSPESVPNLPGPSAGDIAAAQQMKPDEQKQMIAGMVARLADRLKQNSDDVEGWLRLVRAYTVLGERDKAQTAATDARRALGGDPDKLRRIDDLAKELGLQS